MIQKFKINDEVKLLLKLHNFAPDVKIIKLLRSHTIVEATDIRNNKTVLLKINKKHLMKVEKQLNHIA